MVSKLCLLWSDFDAAVAGIAAAVPLGSFDDVFGVPRGGLPLAVALSHATGCPLVRVVGSRTLVVDDVVETGTALRRVALDHPRHLVWTWVAKFDHGINYAKFDHGINYVRRAPAGVWVVFPWESLVRAGADAAEYCARES